MRNLLLIILFTGLSSAIGHAQWLSASGGIHYSSGNVGIGINPPQGILHVQGSAATPKWIYFSNNLGSGGPNPANLPGLAFGWNKSGANGESIISYNTGNGAAPHLAFTSFNGSTFATEMVLRSGNIGLGTPAPTSRMEIVGEGSFMKFRGAAAPSKTPLDILNLGYSGQTGAMNFSLRLGYPHSQGVESGLKFDALKVLDGHLVLGTLENGQSAGNIGIGTNVPTSKVEVVSDNSLMRMRPVNAVPNTALEIYNMGPVGGSGAMNLAFRIGFPHVGGVNAGERIDLLKIVDGHTVLATTASGNPLGNVGIGSVSPTSKLEIVGDGSLLKLRGTNYAASTPFEIMNLGLQGGTGAMNIALRIGFPGDQGVNSSPKLDMVKVLNGNTILATSDQGNLLGKVGIGVVNPDEALTVKGVIHTKEVRVDLNSPLAGPDYVFEPTYNLAPLTEIESFIKEHKHLPEVPSAQQMYEEGLNLKEMNLLLLKKVEELTLHVIEQNKKLEAQTSINEEQGKKIESLESKLKEQKK
jgi:hypothetical protein